MIETWRKATFSWMKNTLDGGDRAKRGEQEKLLLIFFPPSDFAPHSIHYNLNPWNKLGLSSHTNYPVHDSK